MRASIIIILFLCSSFLLDSCKKYHQDPFLSARTVKARLTRYDWELEKLTINGVDSTEQRRQNGVGCILDFPYDQDQNFIASDCNRYSRCSSYWGFDEDKNLRFEGCIIYPQIFQTNLEYHIIKLYRKNLIFEITHPDTGKHYLFEYNRQQ